MRSASCSTVGRKSVTETVHSQRYSLSGIMILALGELNRIQNIMFFFSERGEYKIAVVLEHFSCVNGTTAEAWSYYSSR
jgi:hypothetical protein